MAKELVLIGKQIILTLTPYADALRISLSWTLIVFGTLCLARATFVIWEWKATKPRDEKFWFICGIFFHWLATIDARALFLLNDNRVILDRTEHVLTSINLCFVFIAAVFYFRALTQFWRNGLWRYATTLCMVLAFLIFLLRVSHDASN